MFTNAITAILLAASVSAVPTSTIDSKLSSRTVANTGVTHTIIAGRGGTLLFEPISLSAKQGDVVEWHFAGPDTHSVVESAFAEPCKPLPKDKGFSSGFFEVDMNSTQASNVYQLVIEAENKPIFYYCSQSHHCQNGMVGVINQNSSSTKHTIEKYTKRAHKVDSSVDPGVVRIGQVLPNPNPNTPF